MQERVTFPNVSENESLEMLALPSHILAFLSVVSRANRLLLAYFQVPRTTLVCLSLLKSPGRQNT